jgi:hypothetical protein
MDSTASEGGDAAMCLAPYPEGGTTCDVCTYNSCCSQEVACLGETPIDDAGVTDCLSLLGCYNACLANPEAGTPDPIGCKTFCEGTPVDGGDGGTTTGHTQQGVMDFDALFTCAASSCAAECAPSTMDAATE